MTLPITLPDWLPWWVPIVVLIPALLYLLVFLFMPFSVMGVKGRLETIDARLDEIQGEIRSLVLRLPEPIRGTVYDELPFPPPARATRPDIPVRPPIPPAARHPDPAEQDNQAPRVRREPSSQRDGYRREAPLRAEPVYDEGRHDDPAPDAYHDGHEPARDPRQRDARREPPRRSEPRLDWPR